MSYFSELDAAYISPRAEWEREHFGLAVLPQDVEEVFASGLIADPIPDDPGEDLWYRDADGEIGVVLTDAEVEAMGGYDEGEPCVECHWRGGHAMGCLAA